ncbi:MAG TPA: hypothetical protein VGP05_16175, partial [Pseudonocardia sp.]|nr:hypothetical protein [Pseudonocardia sp.]
FNSSACGGRPPVAVGRHSVAVRVLQAVTWRGPAPEIGGRPDGGGQHGLGEPGEHGEHSTVERLGRGFGAH